MSLIFWLLLALLDADSFRTREAASKALAVLCPLCWQQLYDVQGYPLEVTLRARKVAADYWRLLSTEEKAEHVKDFRPRGWSYLPWFSGSEWPGGYSGPLGCWGGWRNATVLWLAGDALTMTPPEIIRELERMARDEDKWVRANWHYYIANGGQRRHAR